MLTVLLAFCVVSNDETAVTNITKATYTTVVNTHKTLSTKKFDKKQ